MSSQNPSQKVTCILKSRCFRFGLDARGIIYWELLKPGTTVTAEVYSAQLYRLRDAITRARPVRGKIRLQHDNAKTHVAKVVYKTLDKFRWEILPDASKSPDKAPSDYH